ncbi:MAG: formylglycine-generating enzyme family protein [Bacteroidales bacterium]|nr:formylglycine-generating enzyme family protein [Bacteroidales bacterium]
MRWAVCLHRLLARQIVVCLLLSASFAVSAQVVDSVAWHLDDDSLTITYTLSQQADIRVRVSIDGGHTFSDPLTTLQGDIGKNIAPGVGKTITGRHLIDIQGIEAWNIVFLVEIDDKSVIIWVDTVPIVMMPIEGGTFTMGLTCPGLATHDLEQALPTHEVTLDDYYMARFEVTQQLWKTVMGDNPSLFSGNDSLPVDQVSWADVQIFIARLSQITGYRFHLPTEAQWEYAARGGKFSRDNIYPGTTDSLGSYVWYCGNSGNVTHPVGRKLPNELGLYDMGGNVAEWCSDWAGAYTAQPQTNPRGPRSGDNRILRGGSINSPSWTCTVHDRGWYLPGYTFGCYGFRLALDDIQREIE